MKNKLTRRQRIRYRIRKNLRGTADRPRLSVFRSNKEIYAQLIDDLAGVTICAASSRDNDLTSTEGTKSDVAKKVGEALAAKATAQGINACVFDRGGYLYHGRVKSLADGAREGGLKF
ncbi:MAG: 50S ribosomal protein L18 [Bacteroidota bacterium]